MTADEAKPLREKSIWPWLQCIGMGFVGAGGILTILGMTGNFVPAVCGIAPNLDPAAFTPNDVSGFTFWLTCYGLAMVAVQFVAGHLWVKIKTPILLFVCFVVPMIAYSLMSTYTEMWQWWISGIVIGLFGGCIYMVAGSNIIMNWFAKRTALAISISIVLAGLGQAALSPIHAFFVSTLGWRHAYLASAVLGCCIALPWIIFVLRFRPEDKGVRPYGWEPGLQEITAGADDARGASVKKSILSVAFPMLFLAAAFTSLFGGYQNLWGAFAAEWGFTDPYVAAAMISATALFNLITPVLGFCVDKFGPAKMSFAVIIIQVFSSLGLLFFHGSIPVVLVLVFLYADVNSILLGVLPLLYRKIFGPKNFTKINSYMQFGLGLVGGFAAPILGLIAATFGSYASTLIFGLCLCFIIGLCFLIAYLFASRVTWEDGTHPNPWSKQLYEDPPVKTT
jgi:MFS family permease